MCTACVSLSVTKLIMIASLIFFQAHLAAAHQKDSLTMTRTYGNQSPAGSACVTVDMSCATRWSAKTHLTARTLTSLMESAALSAPMMVLPHHFSGFISLVAPPSLLPPHLWPLLSLSSQMDLRPSVHLPACLKISFQELLWIILWLVFMTLFAFLTMDHICSLVESGIEYIIFNMYACRITAEFNMACNCQMYQKLKKKKKT